MANLSALLKDILLKEDKITVPGLGTFETTYQSAQLDEKTGVIHPPTKSVRLNTSKDSDPDCKLYAALAAIGIAEQDAVAMVSDFVAGVKQKLDSKSSVTIDGVGVIFSNENGIPDLRPVESRLSIDNYGLDTEELEPVTPEERAAAETSRSNGGRTVKGAAQEYKTTTTTRTTTTKTVTTTSRKKEDPEKKNGLLKALLIILPIVAILAILFVLFKDKLFGGGSEPASANVAEVQQPLPQDNSGASDGANTKDLAAESQSTADPDLEILAGAGFANVQPQDLGSKYKKYYLIGGSFKDKQKANQEKRRLGASDLLHVDGSDLYRVYFVGSNSAQEVVDVYRKTIDRGIPSSNIWLLKNSKNIN